MQCLTLFPEGNAAQVRHTQLQREGNSSLPRRINSYTHHRRNHILIRIRTHLTDMWFRVRVSAMNCVGESCESTRTGPWSSTGLNEGTTTQQENYRAALPEGSVDMNGIWEGGCHTNAVKTKVMRAWMGDKNHKDSFMGGCGRAWPRLVPVLE